MANKVSLELTLSCGSSTSGKSMTTTSSGDITQEQVVSNKRKLISIYHPYDHENLALGIETMEAYNPMKEGEEKILSTELKLYEDPWVIKKVLTNSDVNGSSRLLLPTNAVEEHIIKRLNQSHIEKIHSNEGARITVIDYDTNMSRHELTLKRWPSTGSYVFVNNWKRDFEKRRGLKCNDEIAMLWDPFNSVVWFRLLRRGLDHHMEFLA